MPIPWTRPSGRGPIPPVRPRLFPRIRRSSRFRKSGSNARLASITRAQASAAPVAHRFEHPVDQMARIDAVGFGGVIEHQAMDQRWMRDALDIFVGDVGPAVEQGANLGAEEQ